MKSHRRYLTFSLRTLFILLTASAVWLGVVVNRAREQREAVKAIEALGGEVRYDWERQPKLKPQGQGTVLIAYEPNGPVWLRRFIGNDYFQEVISVSFPQASPITMNTANTWIPHLKRLRNLQGLGIGTTISGDIWNNLKAALPNCDISTPLLPVESP